MIRLADHRRRLLSSGGGCDHGSVYGQSSANAQQSFSTPEEAASALAVAVKSGFQRDILKVLGLRRADIVSSGDDVADAEARQRFTVAFDAKHSIKPEGDKKGVLILGTDDFPFPIPLVREKRGWEFDTDAGRLEILYRRIGRNELDAIQTCLAYVDAQNEYAEKDRTGGGAGVYAQRIVSTSGKKDGLYWPSSDGDQSPLGELAAQGIGRRLQGRWRVACPITATTSDPDPAGAERAGRHARAMSSRAR